MGPGETPFLVLPSVPLDGEGISCWGQCEMPEDHRANVPLFPRAEMSFQDLESKILLKSLKHSYIMK